MNKSTLKIPPDLQGEIDSLAGLQGHDDFQKSALAALQCGVRSLAKVAQIKRAVIEQARLRPARSPGRSSEDFIGPKRPQGRPRVRPDEPKPPSSWDRRAPRKYRVGRDYVGQIVDSGAPMQKLPQAAPSASKLELGCTCSEPGCEAVFQVTAEHYEHLQTAKEKFGYRPRCPAHGGNDEAIAKARA